MITEMITLWSDVAESPFFQRVQRLASSSSPMSSARKALEILSSRAFFMASVLGTDGYSLCCPGERDLNAGIFKLFSSFFPCRPVITVVIKSCSGIIVTNIVLYGPDVHIRINKR